MVRYTSEFGTDHDLSFQDGEIIQLSWDGSNFGEPEVLVPRETDRNNYYPRTHRTETTSSSTEQSLDVGDSEWLDLGEQHELIRPPRGGALVDDARG